MKLSEACPGQEYVISKVMARPPLSHRLMAMGIAPGMTVSVLSITIAKGTYHISTGNISVAIRKEEAELILVEKR